MKVSESVVLATDVEKELEATIEGQALGLDF